MKKVALGFSLIIFSFSLCEGQSWVWGRQGNAPMNEGDEEWSIARDISGNIYMTGWFKDSLVFGTDTLVTNLFNTTGVFLVKYDMNGNVLWARQSTVNSGVGTGQGYSVTTDRSGNAYITGSFFKTINFGLHTLNQPYTNSDIFIVKYDPSGNVIWAKQSICRNSNFGTGYSVATDKMNNVYLTGQFYDSITFDSYQLGCSHYNVFIAKFDSNSNTLWACAPSNSANNVTTGYSVVADSTGNAYMTGTFLGSLNFGITTLSTTGSTEYFLVKYDPLGNVVWAQQSVNSAGSRGCAAAIDAAGYLYTTGSYSGTPVFDSITMPGASVGDIFLAKYKTSGTLDWIKNGTLLNNNSWTGYALASDNKCNIYLSAGGRNEIELGNDTFSITSSKDPLLVVKYDSSGTVLCGSIIASGGDDFSGIAANPSGNSIYIGGDLEDTVTFGSDKIGTNLGTTEWVFLAKWQPCGDIETGTNEVKGESEKVKVYPNPFTNSTTIVVESAKYNVESYLELYDLTGQKIKQLEFTGNTYTLSAEGFAKGMYFVRVYGRSPTGNNLNCIGTTKIVVQ